MTASATKQQIGSSSWDPSDEQHGSGCHFREGANSPQQTFLQVTEEPPSTVTARIRLQKHSHLLCTFCSTLKLISLLLPSIGPQHGGLSSDCTCVPMLLRFQTNPPSPELTTTAEQFVDFYYKTFDSERNSLAALYVPSSTSWLDCSPR